MEWEVGVGMEWGRKSGWRLRALSQPTMGLKNLVIFARGGYGRAELSFASDKDLGYCLDTKELSSCESEICKQFIIHIEHLLRIAGIETSHLYFELNEDLSRFKDQNSIYTIPSILESRVLIGSKNLAEALKRRFFVQEGIVHV